MKISFPRFFAFSQFPENICEALKSISKLDVMPIVSLKNFNLLDNKDATKVAIYLDEKTDISKINLASFYIAASGTNQVFESNQKIIYEVSSLREAEFALEKNAIGLIVKGNEASGLVGDDSTFVLFQKINKLAQCPIWLRGGIGIHTTAAAISLGAQGVVFEDECFLFSEFGFTKDLQGLITRLDGSETRVNHGRRFYINAPYWPKGISKESIEEKFLVDVTSQYPDSKTPAILFGQSIGLAKKYKEEFSTFGNFVTQVRWLQEGHLQQARHFAATKINQQRFQKDFGVKFPIAQGPMTRVSDEPEFTLSVADAGGLPFFALALLKGAKAKDVLVKTQSLLGDKKWGVGVLGFVQEELQNEQFSYIADIKPPFVLVAGGNASHVKRFESIGSTVLLHAPSVGLLDSFLKEGVKGFIFEGRECGGHVGPLSSFVLWEKQIGRLLQEKDLQGFTVYFAGGIHDSFSSAFISIMASSLVARGVKVGVLMGTSYLYTQEAVGTGAIQEKYQHALFEHAQTALLESSPGHVVRCLPTPFVDHFVNAKKTLLASQLDSRKIQQELEDLNVGRLRLASKGIKRTENGLEKASEAEQLTEGLYMVGQVATMNKSLCTIQELHNDVVNGANDLVGSLKSLQEPEKDLQGIAIIGMACIFPDANNIDTYWKNILGNKNCVTEVPKNRWDSEKFFDADSKKGVKSNSKWGGFIPETDFDPIEFGIPPQSVAAIDPAQLLSLQVTKNALVDAGYWENDELDKENTAVIFGLEGGSELLLGYELRATLPRLFGTVPSELDDILPSLTEDSFSGTLPNVISGRIANRLDFRGRNFVVDAACASSLAAVDVACQELNNHRANVVVAGAVDLHNDLIDYLKFSSVGALSSEGTCKSFAKDAKGIALGEGVGVVILKRLEDAVRDGDKIYSVIKGIGSSSDGKSLGLTAPRKVGQMIAYQRAYKEAGVSPAKVGLIEGHGTGTVVGDKTELESLTDFFVAASAMQQKIGLGSVKTQIGHTKCAAGLAALIKTSLAVYHGVKPASLHLTAPNEYYNELVSPFEFCEQPSVWSDSERVAGVSAFGFGGTNFHLVLQNHFENNVTETTQNEWPSELIVVRTENPENVSSAVSRILNIIRMQPSIRLSDLAYSLALENNNRIQVTLIAHDIQDLVTKLQSILESKPIKDVFNLSAIEGKTAFMFSGQGSQRINMAKDLFVAFPRLRSLLPTDELQDILFPKRSFDVDLIQQQKAKITQTENAQPLLGVIDLAIAKLLQDFGIQPDEVAGHSYGEIPALAFAGAIAEKDLINISRARAQSILMAAGEDPGAMVALNIDKTDLEKFMSQISDLYLANHNSDQQWVVAGTSTAIQNFMQLLDKHGRAYNKLRVACAFHSPIIQDSQSIFHAALDKFNFNNIQLLVWSNTTADYYSEDASSIKLRLCEHLVKPVKFYDQIKAMHKSGVKVFIETGPGKILTNLVSSILGSEAVTLNTEAAAGNGLSNLTRMLAQYIATGRSVNFDCFFEGRQLTRLNLYELEKPKAQRIIWRLRGNRADPLNMVMPTNGSKELLAPIELLRSADVSENYQVFTKEHGMREKLILDYLANMRSMIEAQQKVMMSYFNESNSSGASLTPALEYPTISTPVAQYKTEAVAAPIAVKEPALQSKNLSTQFVQMENVKEKILEIICEKTGYPVDMLDDQMDLESDLSIDSIKRTEIIASLKTTFQTLFDSSRSNMTTQKLSSLKTINELVEYLSDRQPETNVSAVVTASIALAIPLNITEGLMTIVSERTGYPTDMLDMDMDLEADLSIDSIKRTEILNCLKTRLSLPDNELTKNKFTQLARCKTLRAMESLLNGFEQVTSQESSVKKQLATTKLITEEVRRYNFELVRTHLQTELIAGNLAGKVIGIFEDGSDEAITLHGYLASLGADVKMVSLGQSLKELDGLVYLDLSVSKTRLVQEGLFALTKSLSSEKLQWFFSVTDVYSRIANKQDPDAILRELSGSYGFVNSLNKEWMAICREINIDTDAQYNLPEIIGSEFFKDIKEESVIYHKEDGRYVNILKESTWDTSSSGVNLAQDDVVLVLGGAQGITSEILQELAAVSPCHYVLVGRTPVPVFEPNDFSVEQLSQTIDEIKKSLLIKEKFKSPKELEDRARNLYKENQIILTMKQLEANKAKAYYYSVDLTNGAALSELIVNVYSTFGKIDGIIHAAGHLEDKLLVDKNAESFNRVLATKLAPLHVLINEFKPSLKYCVLFSSVTSVFGNRGQIDYGTANAVFDQLANTLDNLLPGRVVAINWGPWKGKGMIDQALEKDFLRRGVTLIPLAAGAKAFVSELQYGKGGQAILMTPVENMEKAKEQF